MRKEERMMGILGQLPDTMLQEAMCQQEVLQKGTLSKVTRKKWWLFIPMTAACAWAVVIGIGFSRLQPESDNQWPVKEVYVDGNKKETEVVGMEENQPEIGMVPHWDELIVSQQYNSMKWNGRNYYGTTTMVQGDMAGELLGQGKFVGQDYYKEIIHEREDKLFAISGISPECAVAAQLDGTLYVYRTHEYEPETLGDLIEALNLRENLQFGSIGYSYWKDNGDYTRVEFTGIASEIVWEMLLSDTEAITVLNYFDKIDTTRIMGISIDIPLIGYENISLSITEEGYITTNILDTGKAFFIGTENTKAFVDYVMENCEGYEILYVYEEVPENEVEDKAAEEGTVVRTSEAVSPALPPE